MTYSREPWERSVGTDGMREYLLATSFGPDPNPMPHISLLPRWGARIFGWGDHIFNAVFELHTRWGQAWRTMVYGADW